MINVFKRDKGRFSARQRAAKRRRGGTNSFRGEQLEARALLAGDLMNAYHNVDMPGDVSGDGRVSLNDALLLVSELRRSGPRQLDLHLTGPGSGSEGESPMFFDVNGDTLLTLADPLEVVSELRSEGEGVANPDTFIFPESTGNRLLPVLANDGFDVGDTLQIQEILLSIDGGGSQVSATQPGMVIEGDSGSTFAISADRQTIIYNQRPGFFGTERVTYRLSDGSGVSPTVEFGQATINIPPTNAAANYRLVATDLNGTPLPNNSIEQGEEFLVAVFVQDIRTDLGDPSILGLESAYLDVGYDMTQVTLLTNTFNTVTFGNQFPDLRQASFSPGEIGEIGAARSVGSVSAPLGGGEFLLFSARFRADQLGTTQFDGNHPEDEAVEVTATELPGGLRIYSTATTPPSPPVVLSFQDLILNVTAPGFAIDDTLPATEDVSNQTLNVLANDTQPAVGMLSIDSVTQPANGMVTIDRSGASDVVTYTPNANFSGTDTFTYIASDGNGNTDAATVTVNVADVNDPPDAVNDTFNVQFNSSAQTLDVKRNDTTGNDLPTSETLTVTAVNTTGTAGTVTLVNGVVSYQPAPGTARLTDSFSYTLSDGRGGTDMATVTINLSEFADTVSIRLAASASMVNVGDTITIDVFVRDLRSDPSLRLGVAQAFLDLDYDASLVRPVPSNPATVARFPGPYEPFSANPPEIDFTNGVIQHVGGFHPDSTNQNGIVNGGQEFPLFSIDFVAIASGTAVFTTDEADDQSLYPFLLSENSTDTFAVLPEDIDFGTTQVTITPEVFPTDVIVRIEAIDEGDPSTTADDVPITTIDRGDTFQIRVSLLDTRANIDNPGLISAFMDLLIAELGSSVTLVPNSFMAGDAYDLFSQLGTVTPGVGIMDIGAAAGTSFPEVARNQPVVLFTLDFVAAGTGSVTFQTADANNPDLTFRYLEGNPNTPAGRMVPLEEITFGATTVTIVAPNAPTAVNDTYNNFFGGVSRTIVAPGVLLNDLGNPTSAQLASTVSNGTLVFNPNGSFTYTPNAGFVGTDIFTYRAIANGITSNVATVRLNVVALGDLTANDDTYFTPVNQPLTTTAANGVLANDVGANLTATVVNNVNNGTLNLNADGSFNYTPNTGFTGVDVFTYQVTDASGQTRLARVGIGVGVAAAGLNGRVYIDSNINGIYEPQLGELAVGNAEVTISGFNGLNPAGEQFIQRTVTTNAQGIYNFGQVLPGYFQVVEMFPEFLLSGTVTTSAAGIPANVNFNTLAGLDRFTVEGNVFAGQVPSINFGHMGVHPSFLSYRDMSGSVPNSGLLIANGPAGNNLWYAIMPGWEGISNPSLVVNANSPTASLTVQSASGPQSFTFSTSGTSRYRVMGVRPGIGSLTRIEGTRAQASSAGEAEGEFDVLALDALMAEGFE